MTLLLQGHVVFFFATTVVECWVHSTAVVRVDQLAVVTLFNPVIVSVGVLHAATRRILFGRNIFCLTAVDY